MIHVARDEIWEKRNKKDLVRVINENNNSLRCEKLYGSESRSRVTGNNLNSVSLLVIYRLNGPTAIDRALRVNSRTLRRPCKWWISCETYRETANNDSVKVKTALKLLSTSFAMEKKYSGVSINSCSFSFLYPSITVDDQRKLAATAGPVFLR